MLEAENPLRPPAAHSREQLKTKASHLLGRPWNGDKCVTDVARVAFAARPSHCHSPHAHSTHPRNPPLRHSIMELSAVIQRRLHAYNELARRRQRLGALLAEDAARHGFKL